MAYETGTISVSGSNQRGDIITVTGSSTNWISADSAVQKGYLFQAGSGWGLIESVTSQTSITARVITPFSTGSGQTYTIIPLGAAIAQRIVAEVDALLAVLGGVLAILGADATLTLSRDSTSDVVAFDLQTNASTRARISLGAGNDLVVSTSANGSTFVEALRFDNSTGAMTPANVSGAIEGLGLTNIAAVHQGYGGGDNTTNTANGRDALSSNTTGSSNTANGRDALSSNTTGSSNTANGRDALSSNTTGNSNTANGRDALSSNTTGNSNTANGRDALSSNTTGNSNTANGVNALSSNTTGGENTANGVNALLSNTTGSENTANGVNALRSNTTGSENTANGVNALRYRVDGSDNTDYSNCSGLGADARVSGNNQVQLGDSSTTVYAFGAVQDRSDRRDKADIEPCELGSDFLCAHEIVAYRWDYRDDYFDVGVDGQLIPVPKDGSRKRTRRHCGVIAQDVVRICEDMNVDFAGLQHHERAGGDDVFTIGYQEYTPILIKGHQEHDARIVGLEDEVIELKTLVASLSERLEALEAAND